MDLGLPHMEHGTRDRTGRQAIPPEHRNAKATHMIQSPPEATGARQDQSPPEATGARQNHIFLQLLDGSTIPYCTPRPEIRLIGLEICRLTNISVYHQLLTLEGRELHTGDIIPPNCRFSTTRRAPVTWPIPMPGCARQRAPNTLVEHDLRTNSTYIHAGWYELASPSSFISWAVQVGSGVQN